VYSRYALNQTKKHVQQNYGYMDTKHGVGSGIEGYYIKECNVHAEGTTGII
jgi:hypothetical protein